jgi:hypothetical protein
MKEEIMKKSILKSFCCGVALSSLLLCGDVSGFGHADALRYSAFDALAAAGVADPFCPAMLDFIVGDRSATAKGFATAYTTARKKAKGTLPDLAPGALDSVYAEKVRRQDRPPAFLQSITPLNREAKDHFAETFGVGGADGPTLLAGGFGELMDAILAMGPEHYGPEQDRLGYSRLLLGVLADDCVAASGTKNIAPRMKAYERTLANANKLLQAITKVWTDSQRFKAPDPNPIQQPPPPPPAVNNPFAEVNARAGENGVLLPVVPPAGAPPVANDAAHDGKTAELREREAAELREREAAEQNARDEAARIAREEEERKALEDAAHLGAGDEPVRLTAEEVEGVMNTLAPGLIGLREMSAIIAGLNRDGYADMAATDIKGLKKKAAAAGKTFLRAETFGRLREALAAALETKRRDAADKAAAADPHDEAPEEDAHGDGDGDE